LGCPSALSLFQDTWLSFHAIQASLCFSPYQAYSLHFEKTFFHFLDCLPFRQALNVTITKEGVAILMLMNNIRNTNSMKDINKVDLFRFVWGDSNAAIRRQTNSSSPQYHGHSDCIINLILWANNSTN
jgi:hypothetical protein